MLQHSHDLRNGRCSLSGQVYLITFATHQRQRLLDFSCGRLLVRELRRAHEHGLVQSRCWVVMPDHCHWLIELREAELSRVVQGVKSRSAKAINQQLGRNGAVWQSGFHDRALRREENLLAAARYIVANPLRAGLVQRVGDYPLWDAVWL